MATANNSMVVRARAATFLLRCSLNSKGLDGGFAPRQIRRSSASWFNRRSLDSHRFQIIFGEIAENYKISAAIEHYYEASIIKASVSFFGGRKHQK